MFKQCLSLIKINQKEEAFSLNISHHFHSNTLLLNHKVLRMRSLFNLMWNYSLLFPLPGWIVGHLLNLGAEIEENNYRKNC